MRFPVGDQPDPNKSEQRTKGPRPIIVPLFVATAALLRVMPATLIREEPLEFWARVPTIDPLRYLLETWAGYL